jgi:hypothetical protein
MNFLEQITEFSGGNRGSKDKFVNFEVFVGCELIIIP